MSCPSPDRRCWYGLLRRGMIGCSALLACLAGIGGFAESARGENWPNWRGERGDGSSRETAPVKWSAKTGEGIVWKTPIPGVGHSSPIVWEETIIVFTCLPDSQERVLMAIDRKSGKVRWQKTVLAAPLEKKHKLNSYASGTPATDGKLIYLSFLEADFGSEKDTTPGNLAVAAYNFQGEQVWIERPGRFSSVHGFCSSPVLFEDKVIVNGDHDGPAYIVALDRKTGKTAWKVSRENKTRSYVTPIIRDIGGRTQMLLTGSKSVVSIDPRSGERQWTLDGPTQQFVASPVFDGKLLYITAGFPEYHILAIRPEGSGKLDDSSIVWRTKEGCSYVPSPVVLGDYFVVAADTGIASCFIGATGERLWKERLGPHFSASLVTANGLIYFLPDDGVMKVVRPGKTLEVVSENDLGENCYASPAISQGRMYIRTESNLIAIGEPEGK